MKLIDAYDQVLGQMDRLVDLMRRASDLATDEDLSPEIRARAKAQFMRLQESFTEAQALANKLLAQAGIEGVE